MDIYFILCVINPMLLYLVAQVYYFLNWKKKESNFSYLMESLVNEGTFSNKSLFYVSSPRPGSRSDSFMASALQGF